MAKKNVKQVTVDEIKAELLKIGITEVDEKHLITKMIEKIWETYQEDNMFFLYLLAMQAIYKNNPNLAQLVAINREKLNSSLMYLDYLINRIK